MVHQRTVVGAASPECRSPTEILADARAAQARHAPRLFDAAARWLQDRLSHRAGPTSASPASRLVLH